MPEWWSNRSRPAKFALGALGVFVAFGLIGALADPQPEAHAEEAAVIAPRPAAAAQPAKGASKPRAQRTFAVRRVVDGDTIELGNGTVVRLVQIDAPEVGSSECYASKSTATLRQLLPRGRVVRVVADPRLDRVDRYGRQLAYVFKGDELIQATLVARGAASPWFYDGDRGRYAGRLLARAEEAKAAGRGLWGACPGTELDPSRAVATVRPAPKPKPQPVAQPQPAAPPAQNCHPSYAGECLDPALYDYDCAGGSGDGPGYVQGTVRVVGPDEYRLDGDGDGLGCE